MIKSDFIEGILEFTNVSKRYKTVKGYIQALEYPFNAVIGVDINKAPILSFIGPNGSGKTTLLSILSGQLRPDEGTVLLHSCTDKTTINVTKDPLKARKHIVYTFQDKKFDPKYSIENNLIFHCQIWKLNRPQITCSIKELLKEFDLYEKRKLRHYQLSGGQQKQLEMIRGFLIPPDPKKIFLFVTDEPTAYCDIDAQKKIWNRLNERTENNIPIILATNDLGEAETYSSEGIFLRKGKIFAQGTIAEIRSQFTQENMVEIECSNSLDAEQLLSAYMNDRYNLTANNWIKVNTKHHTYRIWSNDPQEDFARLSILSQKMKIPILRIEVHRISLEELFTLLSPKQVSSQMSIGVRS